MGPVLVVGASGILAPAAAALAARGVTVTGVARHGAMPAGVEALHVDASDVGAMRATLGARRWSAAIVYAPTVVPSTLAVVDAAADRVVLVRTTAAVAPGLGEAALPPGVLQLGWTAGEGASRWHTAEEISAAALEVLDDGEARVLGEIRLWERRP